MGFLRSVPESRSQLDSVLAAYSGVLACSSFRRRFLFASSSFASSHAQSCSPVSCGHCSGSSSHSRTRRLPSAGVGSSRTGLWKVSPSWSHSSRLPSRTSSRYGSASPGDSRHCSCSRSRSPPQRSDFLSVVATMQFLNELVEAAPESCKIRGFRVPSSGMRSKVSKLLTYPGVCNRRFYRFEGEELSKARSLNRHVT